MAPKKEASAAPTAPEAQAPTAPAPATAKVIAEEVVPVAMVPHKASAVASLADVAAMVEDDAGQGHGFEKGDLAIPFLRVLQSNSPQVKRKEAAYIDGAVEGHFLHTAQLRTYDGEAGIDVIPVHFMRQATLWWPREQGGPKGEKGFVREVPIPEAQEILKTCTKNEKGKDVTPDGQELVFAALYYVMVVAKDGSATFENLAFPLTSTQLKKARSWNAVIQGSRLPNANGVGSYNPAMYGYVYHITTVPESNNKGSWMGVKIVQGEALLKYVDGAPAEGFPGAAQLYLAAREFKALVGAGRVKTVQDDIREDVTGTGGAGATAEDDDDLPF